ncbi:acyltransferase [Pseudomonas sp. GD03862]|uniref:acyltransferase family protein n=1 Tax=Pseudomonas sp. GD03862 TaxID=2975391 RepID=UPI002447586D|nr:acyltransferase [Pseudomonas sp. GD03862]MDH0707694.1 acyltransferase [Pseudomonas sp. GD03862]
MPNNNETLPQDLNTLRSRKGMRLDVQGLRAVAVLAVLICHMGSAWLPAGFVGVEVFFVISGFIITALLTEPGQKIHLAGFYLNRIKRIVPAYAAMLAAAILLVWSTMRVETGAQGSHYFSLLARIPEFLVGGVAALGLRDREIPSLVSTLLGLLGLGLLAASFVLIDKTLFPGLWLLAPCLGTALVIAARRGHVNNLLATPGWVWVGGISYSLYLWRAGQVCIFWTSPIQVFCRRPLRAWNGYLLG